MAQLNNTNISAIPLKTSIAAVVTPDPLTAFLQAWENSAGNIIKGHVLGIGLILTCVNNFLILLILCFGHEVENQMTKSMRIYYAAIALGDTSTVFPLHATYFAGKHFEICIKQSFYIFNVFNTFNFFNK